MYGSFFLSNNERVQFSLSDSVWCGSGVQLYDEITHKKQFDSRENGDIFSPYSIGPIWSEECDHFFWHSTIQLNAVQMWWAWDGTGAK